MRPATTSITPAEIAPDPIQTETPAVRNGWPCSAVNWRMAIEKRPMANPKTTMAAPVRTQARNVRSFAKWSRARLGFSFSAKHSPSDLLHRTFSVTHHRDGEATAIAAPRALFHSLCDQYAGAGKILDEFFGHTMPVFQIRRIVVGDCDLSSCILSHQRLQRQIDGQARGRHHQRRSAFWTAEDEDLGRVHC